MARISKKAAAAPVVAAPVAAPKARKAAPKAAPKSKAKVAKGKTKVVASVKRAGSARRKAAKKK